MNGNQVAEEQLYNKYKKIVHSYINCKYPTCYDTDDEVSEIMIKIFMNLNKYDLEKSKFKTWVITIIKNHMIDKWRSSTTASHVTNYDNSSISYSNNVSSYCSGVSTVIERINPIQYTSNLNGLCNCISTNYSTSVNFENINAVNFISSQISETDFAMLNMKYMQGYNYEEIGKQFSITSSTVSNKINYLKTKIKRNMLNEIKD